MQSNSENVGDEEIPTSGEQAEGYFGQSIFSTSVGYHNHLAHAFSFAGILFLKQNTFVDSSQKS